jgi:hypothetical protein
MKLDAGAIKVDFLAPREREIPSKLVECSIHGLFFAPEGANDRPCQMCAYGATSWPQVPRDLYPYIRRELAIAIRIAAYSIDHNYNYMADASERCLAWGCRDLAECCQVLRDTREERKPPWSREQAREHLKSISGPLWFDPEELAKERNQ